MLDQPTIVKNARGQRPVENLVASTVSRRYGGMQPANRRRKAMFGAKAPIWQFLRRFGGPADPHAAVAETRVVETYPVLAIIALGWTLADAHRPAGRLPKYNPARKTFSRSDWRHVCHRTASEFNVRGLSELAQWLEAAAGKRSPRKHDQDRVDACICLLVALHLAEKRTCLMVGNTDTGYIVVPAAAHLCMELRDRCQAVGLVHAEWVQPFVATVAGQAGIRPPARRPVRVNGIARARRGA